MLTIYDKKRMSVVRTFKASPLLAGVLMFLFIVVVGGVTVVIVGYTPVKYAVLGYDVVTMRERLVATTRALDSLLRIVEAQEQWINAIRASVGDTFSGSLPVVSMVASSSSEQVSVPVLSASSVGRAHDRRISLSMPAEGNITNRFNPSARHFGIDIKTGKGQAVRAAASGVVILADYTVDNGYTVVIAHGGGWLTVYKHCARILSKPMEFVRQGEVIATAGGTGYLAKGVHLHFEVWYQAVPVDPLAVLPAAGI